MHMIRHNHRDLEKDPAMMFKVFETLHDNLSCSEILKYGSSLIGGCGQEIDLTGDGPSAGSEPVGSFSGDMGFLGLHVTLRPYCRG